MVSAILTVPAALGLAHLLRARGAALGHLGAACRIIGAFGHMGYAVRQLILSRAAGPGAPALIAYLDRTSVVALVLVPLMILLDVGLVLLAAGLLRAGAVPRWAPWLIIVTVAADFAIQFTSITATWPVTVVWGVLVVSFGSIGVRVLTMTPAAWGPAWPRPRRPDPCPPRSPPEPLDRGWRSPPPRGRQLAGQENRVIRPPAR